jgi:hypothetical protein
MAVALPALVLVLTAALAAVGVTLVQLRCLDAATVGARLAARGEATEVVRASTAAVAPDGAAIAVSVAGDVVTVTVTATTRLPVLGLALPPLHLVRSFTQEAEPGVAPP